MVNNDELDKNLSLNRGKTKESKKTQYELIYIVTITSLRDEL